jgi:RimJ/RimL family protein N-acetyltransferase
MNGSCDVTRDSARLPTAAMHIRPMRRADVPYMRDGFASGVAAQTTRWTFPRSLPSMLGWFDDAAHAKNHDVFAILVEGRVVGVTSLRPPRYGGRELTIAIFDPRARGRGVGTFAVTALCEYGFSVLRLARIELGVYPTHHAAIACYAKCGFKYEALLRRFLYQDGIWRDAMWMSLLRSEAKARFSIAAH